eukprot:CAMPEP_0198669624 /NCGR_PEP_ID=MMETSP1467-20131203/76789_1 /TAXON_ID=1462469 /ORGANISM="unid. sp., Strain CCMP2135" /LENGTH=83 /DNA_ID=CAMNT_0044406379 /DNA_START=221 /DNA_END=468 /DNA_ORIENTATION=-
MFWMFAALVGVASRIHAVRGEDCTEVYQRDPDDVVRKLGSYKRSVSFTTSGRDPGFNRFWLFERSKASSRGHRFRLQDTSQGT